MHVSRPVVAVVAVILVTTLVSGPLVGAVDLTTAKSYDSSGLGEGSAAVGNVSLPGTATIEAGEFGSGTYYLQVPPASVEFVEMRGKPILNYEIAIPALGYTQGPVYFLSASDAGQFGLAIDTSGFDPDDITQDAYNATFSLSIRTNESERTIERANVTVEVVE